MNRFSLAMACIFIFMMEGIYSQTCTVTGATTTTVNGIYVSSNPATQDGAYYYTKSGSPNLYLYRTGGSGTKYWSIGSDLGSSSGVNKYYYAGNVPNDSPDGLTLNIASGLGSGPSYPSIKKNLVMVSGANEAIVNGTYFTSDPATQDGAYYYTKSGSPNLYLYRTGGSGTKYWSIGSDLGSSSGVNKYYYAGNVPNDSPDGLTLNITSGLGSGPPYPTVGDIPLPVELTSFTAKNTIEGVLCLWTTESEIENLGFILERKTIGNEWQEIASYKTVNALMGQGTTSSPTNYEYLDTFIQPNTLYEYRLADIDYDGIVTYHSVRTVTVEKAPLSSVVEGFTVLPAYPNPFNPSTTITYGIENDSRVNIDIYDISGKLITTLLNTEQQKGWYSVEWNGTDKSNYEVPAGIYLSRITSDNEVKTTKLMLLK